jgi:5-methylthioribose kinase
VEGPAGGICVKQALPYVRVVGEAWPLTQDRLRIEAAALQAQHTLCPQHVPQVRPGAAATAMQCAATRCRLLRT